MAYFVNDACHVVLEVVSGCLMLFFVLQLESPTQAFQP